MGDAAYILAGHRSMTQSDVQGGSAEYNGEKGIPATIGTFEIEDPLMTGGHSPRLMGVIEIADEDLPADSELATDQEITVTDGLGRDRDCKIVSWKQSGPLWQIAVHDLNQGS